MEDMLPSVADSAAQNANLQRTMCARFLRQSGIKKAPLDWGAFFMARPGGFEPSTYRFVAGHSIH